MNIKLSEEREERRRKKKKRKRKKRKRTSDRHFIFSMVGAGIFSSSYTMPIRPQGFIYIFLK